MQKGNKKRYTREAIENIAKGVLELCGEDKTIINLYEIAKRVGNFS